MFQSNYFLDSQSRGTLEKGSNKFTTTRYSNGLVIDYTQRIIYHENKQILFSRREFDIIELLSMNLGQIFDKEQIYEKIWGHDADGDSNVIKEHVRKIRSKFMSRIEKDYIETVWGVGYKWVK